MNKVIIEPHERSVAIHPHGNTVKLEVIHIESQYHYAHPGQVVDVPKERE